MVKDFMMGCDPEFGFKKGARYHSADSVISDAPVGDVGLDGCGRVAEIRPYPAYEPTTLVKNIRAALINMALDTPESLKYTWEAGSMSGGDPIGGHLHFGTKAAGWDKFKLPEEHLNSYLAQPCLLLEYRHDARARRLGTSYGSLVREAVRTQEHGFEYRPLGSWLTSPWIALGVISLAKAIVWESGNRALPDVPKNLKITSEDYNSYSSNTIRPRLSGIYEFITGLELYNTERNYKRSIDFLFNLIQDKRSWFPGVGMMAAWGIPTSTSAIASLVYRPMSIEQIVGM